MCVMWGGYSGEWVRWWLDGLVASGWVGEWGVQVSVNRVGCQLIVGWWLPSALSIYTYIPYLYLRIILNTVCAVCPSRWHASAVMQMVVHTCYGIDGIPWMSIPCNALRALIYDASVTWCLDRYYAICNALISDLVYYIMHCHSIDHNGVHISDCSL